MPAWLGIYLDVITKLTHLFVLVNVNVCNCLTTKKFLEKKKTYKVKKSLAIVSKGSTYFLAVAGGNSI